MKTKNLVLAGVVALLAGCSTDKVTTARSPTTVASTTKTLPSQQLLDEGRKAAQRGDWDQAVRFYSLAQKKAYLSPQIMYNLAVAHSKAGHELLADVWFRAYLSAVPEAVNAEQVRTEIDRLEKATQAKVDRLFEQAEQLAEQLPVQGESANVGGRRENAFKQIALSRIQVGDFKGADEDVRKAKQLAVEKYWFGGYLEGENKNSIFAKTLADAEEYAKNIDSAITKRFTEFSGVGESTVDYGLLESQIRRDGIEFVFEKICSGHHTSIFEPRLPIYELNHIIKYSIYLGDMQNARRADRILDDFIQNGIPFPDEPRRSNNKRWVSGYTQLGKAYLDVENGRTGNAIKRIDQGAHDVNTTSTEHPEGLYEALRLEWLCDICNFAISRGKLAAADQIADAFNEGHNQIEFLKKIVNAYEVKNDAANTERLKQKLASLTAAARQGWDSQDSQREVAINAWEDVAYDFDQQWEMTDPKALLFNQKWDSEQAPMRVASAASDLGCGLLKIHALEKRYR